MTFLPTAKQLRFALVALLAVFGSGPTRAAEPVLRVLILSGQNNHNWRETTPKLKSILESGGRFSVDFTEHPERCDAATFKKYDVLLSNWNTFGKAMGEDALRVLDECLKLEKSILNEVRAELPHVREGVKWAAHLPK